MNCYTTIIGTYISVMIHLQRKKCTTALFILLLCAFPGCTTSMIVENWQTLPRNSAIEIHTSDGKVYRLDNWRINDDSSIVGIGKADSSKWTTFSIPKNSVVAVYVNNPRSAETLETAATVIGSVAGIAAVFWIVNILGHTPGIPVGFGPF